MNHVTTRTNSLISFVLFRFVISTFSLFFFPEDLLHTVLSSLRLDLRKWDNCSRSFRRSILERFLWLHSNEKGGLGIGNVNQKSRKEEEGGKNEQKESHAKLPSLSSSQEHKE